LEKGQDISIAEKWKTRLNKHKDSQAMTTTTVNEDKSLAMESLNKPNGFETDEEDEQNTRDEILSAIILIYKPFILLYQ